MKASLPRLNSFTAFKENAYGKPVGADPPWSLLHRLLSAQQPLPPPCLLLSHGLIGWGMVASEAASKVAVVEHREC